MIGLSTMNTIRVRDLLERMLWTAVSAAGGALVGAAIFDFNAWEAAAPRRLPASSTCSRSSRGGAFPRFPTRVKVSPAYRRRKHMKPEREDELIERHLKKRIAQGLNECEVTPEEQEELDRGF